ncbi:MAG: M1 family metallopeptidase [Acidobacteriia bacterium]|nr:M1 family metallopeptidase [Terriglobia bacterium]
MRNLQLLPLIAILSSLASAQPRLRLSEVEDIAPTNYRADLTLDPDKDGFSGAIAIRLDIRKPAQTIWLNANKISVQEATVAAGGKTLQAKILPGGDDFLGFQFDSAIPAGSAELNIRYTGAVRRGDSSGIFSVEDKGNRYIFTQFETTDARDAFPCFDEPSYKTPWQLTLRIPAQAKAVSNTSVDSENAAGAVRTVVFRQTKPLPSYLVAFAVGPFEFVDAGYAGKNRVPVRIVTPKGRADEAKYAAEVTATILTRLEDYFGFPYPYEKSDQVAVPTTGFGAMENAGMVTYAQNTLLAASSMDSISRQRRYATIAAHELAHMWVGDLVTTAWWDDIWLNEAFATWMEEKLVAEWKPEWKTRVADVDSKLGAESADSLVTAREIRQPIKTKDDISNAFDTITYEKGAAVIGMFESWMGPEAFRKGVQAYLVKYAFKNATSADFLASLTAAAGKKDVAGAFSTFLNQPGVPLVSMALDCAPKTPVLHLQQSRFLPIGSKGSTDRAWQIPVCIRYGAAAECSLLTGPRMDWPLKAATSCPAWVEANGDAKGYYLVDYRNPPVAALTGGGRLEAPERVDLIGDVRMLSGGGKLPASDALGLVPVFHDDPERLVVQRDLEVALSFHTHLVSAPLEPNYQHFLLRNFQTRARELGWSPKPGESDDVRLLRPSLVGAMAMYGGDAELAKQAQSLTDKWLQDRTGVSPDMLGTVLGTAAYYGRLDLFNRFLAEYKKTQDRQEKQRLLSAMAGFHDRAAIAAGFQAVLSKQIPMVDGFELLLGSGQGFSDTRKMAFEFIKSHFDQIMAGNPSIFGNDLGQYLPYSGQSFCDAGSRNELQAFFGPIVSKFVGAPRTLAQVLEGIDLCIAGQAAEEPSVKAFLEKY